MCYKCDISVIGRYKCFISVLSMFYKCVIVCYMCYRPSLVNGCNDLGLVRLG